MADDPDLFPPPQPVAAPPSLPDLPPVQHAGERVLTTELLAGVYGVDEKALQDNYQANRERFVDGVHFHKLTGTALREFKNEPGNSGLVGAKASHLTLWTERGAARHAKMLHTDAAWAVFGKLEETYFETAAAPAPPTVVPLVTSSIRTVAADFKALFSIGRLIGLDRNQSALAANRGARKVHDIDLLATMETKHLDAPQQAPILTPTDIGSKLGMSGQAVNKLLIDRGFQTEFRDAKDRPVKEPTDTGHPFAVWQDTAKRHSDGTPVRQLKWSGDIVALLQARPNEEAA